MHTVCPVPFFTDIRIIIIQNILPSNKRHVLHEYIKHRIKISTESSDKNCFLNKACSTRKFPYVSKCRNLSCNRTSLNSLRYRHVCFSFLCFVPVCILKL